MTLAGDHPDLCQRRMQWALRAVRDAYAAYPDGESRQRHSCPEASAHHLDRADRVGLSYQVCRHRWVEDVALTDLDVAQSHLLCHGCGDLALLGADRE